MSYSFQVNRRLKHDQRLLCMVWLEHGLYMGVSINEGTPKWLVYFMENPIYKWMICGYPYDSGNHHIEQSKGPGV